ncbi:MAG: GAF domain-containing protein [Opitutales bacterium]
MFEHYEDHQRQYKGLCDLTRSGLWHLDDENEAFRLVTETVAGALGVERVSLWRFNPERTAIICDDLFETSADRHSSGREIREDDFPRYFRALAENDVISANDVYSDSRISDLADVYLKPCHIASMLDVPVLGSGVLYGVLCVEHVGSVRCWTHSEHTFALGIVNLVALMLDVRERKRAENKLARLNRLYRMLSKANEAIARISEPQELYDKVCRIALGEGSFSMAAIAAFDAATGRVHPLARSGDKEGYLTNISVDISDAERNCGTIGTAIRTGRHDVCNDMANDPRMAVWRDSAVKHGYRSNASFPIKQNSRVVGVLVLFSGEPGYFYDDEIELLVAISENVSFAIDAIRSEEDRRRADEKVREQAALLDKAQDAILVRDLEHRILYWNKSAARLYGWSAEEVKGRSCRELLYSDPAAFQAATEATLASGEWLGELEQRARGGERLIVECRWTLVRDTDGRPKSILAINTDISARKVLEAQFRRAQRMESIGTLAGGMAHDLNNIFAPILMGMDLLKMEENDEDRLRILSSVCSSARRGADLVKQVLAFARGFEGKRSVVNVLEVATDIREIIHNTFPKAIDFQLEAAQDLHLIEADTTQLHQLLMNLCVNARDAMPHGGRLTLALENTVLDEVFSSMNLEARPGAYILIRLEDTGSGIPLSIQDKIFDPFFTTKEVGQGTGLGLSTGLSIVKSYGGFVNVHSEEGKGATFSVYLPARQATAEPPEDILLKPPPRLRGNGELILVVDDEEVVRNVATESLERFGYRVIPANNGVDAVALYAKHMSKIAVVLTDMAMPVMGGPATIVALKAMNPDVKIIGSSGYTSGIHVSKATEAGVQHFIPKPYSLDTLLETVRDVLAK